MVINYQWDDDSQIFRELQQGYLNSIARVLHEYNKQLRIYNKERYP